MLFSEHISFYFKNGLPHIEFKDKMGRTLSIGDALEKISNRIYSYFIDFDLFLVTFVGHVPFYSFRWLIYTIEGVDIGPKAHIHMGTEFFNPRNVVIGEGTVIGKNAFLDGRDKLIIGNHVDIASDVMIYNSEHDINSDDFHATLGPVEIGDYSFIGPRVIILPGVRIGKGAVIAAGAVVTKDVEDFKVVGGVPAREIGERENKNPNYKLGRSRLFQ